MYECINKKKKGSYLYHVTKNYLRSIHFTINVLKKVCITIIFFVKQVYFNSGPSFL